MILLNCVVVVSGRMEAEVGYNPPEEFAEESVDSLVDINLNDSTELWLIQLPENHVIFSPFNISCPTFSELFLARDLPFITRICAEIIAVYYDFLFVFICCGIVVMPTIEDC